MWRGGEQCASDLGSAVCSSQVQSARSLQVLLARVEGRGVERAGEGSGGREGRGSEKTEEEGEGWEEGEGEETAQQTPNTSPRRFTAMRYSYLCLIDCIGGGSSAMCRPFQRATLTPPSPSFFSFFSTRNHVISTGRRFPNSRSSFLLLFLCFAIVFRIDRIREKDRFFR